MFQIFGRRKPVECPIKEEMREWMENSFRWLVKEFGEENIQYQRILTPQYSDFPIRYNGQPEAATDTLKIIAEQMEIDIEQIHLDIYQEGQTEIGTGGVFGNRIFLKQVEGEKYSSGKYWGKQEDGKYHIGIESKKLTQPLDIVATLSHELAHIKLLGEQRITENIEPLTDLTTVVFGLGIFNANAAFQTKRGVDSWGYSRLGYLSQMEWGYALALFAHLRKEKTPEWIRHLAVNVKSDFKKSERWMEKNQIQL